MDIGSILIVLFVIIMSILLCSNMIYITKNTDNNMIIGTKLPRDILDNEDVQKIAKEYRRNIIILVIIIFLLYSPIIFLGTKNILGRIYFPLYVLIILLVPGLVTRVSFNKLQKLKKKNNWYIYSENKEYCDGDKYWGIYFYNNPNDTRTMVKDRFTYGMAINKATTKGKATIIFYILSFILYFIILYD